MDRRCVYMRMCEAHYYDHETHKVETIKGYFHAWGVTYEELNNGVGICNTALVEDEEGQVHECWTDVKFITCTHSKGVNMIGKEYVE